MKGSLTGRQHFLFTSGSSAFQPSAMIILGSDGKMDQVPEGKEFP